MIETVAIVVFGLALASAAQAMPPAPVPQPDSMITQARMGCGAGMVMVNGACVARPPSATRAAVRDGMAASAPTTTKDERVETENLAVLALPRNGNW